MGVGAWTSRWGHGKQNEGYACRRILQMVVHGSLRYRQSLHARWRMVQGEAVESWSCVDDWLGMALEDMDDDGGRWACA